MFRTHRALSDGAAASRNLTVFSPFNSLLHLLEKVFVKSMAYNFSSNVSGANAKFKQIASLPSPQALHFFTAPFPPERYKVKSTTRGRWFEFFSQIFECSRVSSVLILSIQLPVQGREKWPTDNLSLLSGADSVRLSNTCN